MRLRTFITVSILAVSGCQCGEDIVSTVDPIINVEPDHIDFGRVPLGQQALEMITLRNLENVSAEIDSVDVVDDCDGCFRLIDVPTGVEGLSQVPFGLRFRSVRLPIATATVTVNIGGRRPVSHTVTAVGRGIDTCKPDVEVAPAQVDFGFVPAGGLAVSSFAVRSTGTCDLLIDSVSIEPADAPYRITTSTPTPERPGRLPMGSQASVGLRASLPATSSGTVTAKVVIETNVVSDKGFGAPGRIEVPLTATANLPPIARCGEGRNVEPRSPVKLDGSMSADQDVPPDDPLTYRWRFLAVPPGSREALQFSDTPRPEFFADVSGRYEIELIVTDALGLESEPCAVVIEALPTNAIRIELTWDHPDSDLDLHLIQPAGSFCDCMTDVHYRDCARRPNWFPNHPGANPRLDLDDRGGFGPETIDIDGDGPTRFVPDGAYRIAVHYYADNEEISQWPTSTSNATVRIFVFGLLRAEFNHPLSTEGDVWVVGDVVFPGPTVEPNGTVLPSQMCGVF